MSKNSKRFFEDNFFVIDSCNLDNVESRMYGYAILDNEILINSHECNFPFPKDSYGCYVNVVRRDKEIEVYQDYFGSYGLYIYNQDGYFAISNSFLYLVNFLKTRKELSFDISYAKAFISAPQASLAYQDTMIKEIIMLPRNRSVI